MESLSSKISRLRSINDLFKILTASLRIVENSRPAQYSLVNAIMWATNRDKTNGWNLLNAHLARWAEHGLVPSERIPVGGHRPTQCLTFGKIVSALLLLECPKEKEALLVDHIRELVQNFVWDESAQKFIPSAHKESQTRSSTGSSSVGVHKSRPLTLSSGSGSGSGLPVTSSTQAKAIPAAVADLLKNLQAQAQARAQAQTTTKTKTKTKTRPVVDAELDEMIYSEETAQEFQKSQDQRKQKRKRKRAQSTSSVGHRRGPAAGKKRRTVKRQKAITKPATKLPDDKDDDEEDDEQSDASSEADEEEKVARQRFGPKRKLYSLGMCTYFRDLFCLLDSFLPCANVSKQNTT
jgi:hypothetical protein